MSLTTLRAFLRHSFSDARGCPDGKLLTIAAVATMVVLTYPIGWIWQVWPPEYVHSSTLLFLATGLGIDAYVTRTKIKAEQASGVDSACEAGPTTPEAGTRSEA